MTGKSELYKEIGYFQSGIEIDPNGIQPFCGEIDGPRGIAFLGALGVLGGSMDFIGQINLHSQEGFTNPPVPSRAHAAATPLRRD